MLFALAPHTAQLGVVLEEAETFALGGQHFDFFQRTDSDLDTNAITKETMGYISPAAIFSVPPRIVLEFRRVHSC